MTITNKILGQITVDSLVETTSVESVGFAAVAGKYLSNTTAAYSTDGITWTQTTMPASVPWFSVTYGDGKFVAVAGGNFALTASAAYSTNGITWTQTTLPVNAGWFSVTYGDGKFVAVTYYSSTAAYSTDAITWTQTTLPTNSLWFSVTYGDGTFAAVATDSTTAAYSTDGITWAQTTMPVSSLWSSVAYGEKNIIISTYDPKTIYTVPSNTETIVTSIFISNTSNSTETYDFAVVPDGETLSDIHYIRKSVELPANDFNNIETKLTLSAGDQIVAKSLYNNIQINIFGVEKS